MILSYLKRYRHWIGVWAVLFLGLIFVAAGTGKLLPQSENFEIFVFPDFFSPAMVSSVYVWIPRIELTIGVLLILGIAARFIASLSALMIAGFITNNNLKRFISENR